MSTLALTTQELDAGALDPAVLAAPSEAVATVSSVELADNHEGAASDDDIPIVNVLIILVLIAAGVTAGVLGFRSTRRKRDTIEHHGSQEHDPR